MIKYISKPSLSNIFSGCRIVPAIFFVFVFLFAACSKDDIPDPYSPISLPNIRQINFISGNDSSIYYFDTKMILTSGRDNTNSINEKESFTMQYAESGQLTGAAYEYVIGGRNQPRTVTYSRNDRNMVSQVTDGSSQSISLTYDDLYRLLQITVSQSSTVVRYTIEYDGQSNVSSVETYQNTPSDTYTKVVYGNYDSKSNPFRYLVNVFYAPTFSSKYGPVCYYNIPFGMLLSVNNPGKADNYVKSGNDYVPTGDGYTYEYSEFNEDGYPTQIGGSMVFKIEYFK